MLAPILSFLGIGNPSKSEITRSTTIQKQTDYLKEILNENISEVISKSSVSSENYINIDLEAEGSIIFTNASLRQYAKIDADINIKVSDKVTSDTMSDTIIDGLAEISNKVNLLGGENINVNTSEYINTITSVKEQYKSLIKKTNITECVVQSINSTTLKLKSKTADIIIDGLDISQTAETIANCVIENIVDVFSKIKFNTEFNDRVVVPGEVVVKEQTKWYSTILTIVIVIAIIIIAIPVLIIIFMIVRAIINAVKSKPVVVTQVQTAPKPVVTTQMVPKQVVTTQPVVTTQMVPKQIVQTVPVVKQSVPVPGYKPIPISN